MTHNPRRDAPEENYTMTDRTSVLVTIEGSQVVANAKNFASGSRGFWAGEKVTIDGKRYQVSLSIVEIGSKPTAAKPAKGSK